MTSTYPIPDDPQAQSELRHRFNEDLSEVRQNILEMGAAVLDNLHRAGLAVTENRLGEVDDVVTADEPVNEIYHRCEARIFEVLALQQPVASDLRFLVAATRIIYEIERSGDLAVNLVKALQRIHGLPTDTEIHNLLTLLSESSEHMFRSGIEAIAAMDPQIGLDADAADEKVDRLTADLYKLVNVKQEDLGLEVSVALFRMGRFFERIADHGVNIAENVTFMVTAEWPELSRVVPAE